MSLTSRDVLERRTSCVFHRQPYNLRIHITYRYRLNIGSALRLPPNLGTVPHLHSTYYTFDSLVSISQTSTMAEDISAIDYYDLLSISAASSPAEIRRAYRKTSLLYHPDKVAKPTKETTDKFQLLQKALAVLTDDTERAQYDQTRTARLRRQEEHKRMNAARQTMVADLEAREKDAASGFAGVNGAKRKFTEREMDVKRIQEENRKRMAEASVKRQWEASDAARKVVEEQKRQREWEKPSGELPEEDESWESRSVKVKWVREGEGLEVDEAWLREGYRERLEDVVVMEDGSRKRGGKKRVMGRAMLVFWSREKARRAVEKGPFGLLESVELVQKQTEREREEERLVDRASFTIG